MVCSSRGSLRFLLLLAGGLALVFGAGAAAAQAPGSASTTVQKQGRAGPLSKIGPRLATLYRLHDVQGTAGVKRLAPPPVRQTPRARVHSPVSEDGHLVTIDAIASGPPDQLLSDLETLGLLNGAVAGPVVSGRLPIAALHDAAQLTSLRGAYASTFRTHVGSIDSEADTAHAAYKGRNDLNVDGSGVKVCALSDSYAQNQSAATTAMQDVQSGDLPGPINPNGYTTPVDTVDDSAPGTDEGRAMLQLIHDIAPGATLGFHTAVGGTSAFAGAIRELGDPEQGNCDIIVDDIGYQAEPFYQDGPVSNAVADVVTNDGVAYFSSAGNDGQNSYVAPFRNAGTPGVLSDTSASHDFDPSGGTVDTLQKITIEAGGTFDLFTFQWTDPSSLVSGSAAADTDFNVALVNDTLGVMASSTLDSNEDGVGVPLEFLRFVNAGNDTTDTDGDDVPDTTFHLVIERAAGPSSNAPGPAPNTLKYIHFGAGYTIEDDYGAAENPTVYGHPMAEQAMAVAAAPYFRTQNEYACADCPTLESFSSKGGIPILFDRDGNAISPPVRQKPDVTAADGINNTFFGNTDYEGDGNPNFFGTSAAAPNVAAIAALVLEANPGYSPTELYNHLEANATDVTTREQADGPTTSIASGVDPWSGHGFVQAAASALPVELAQFSGRADGETAVLTWRTATETNNAGFAVEHKHGDSGFTELAFMEGAGTTEETTRYRYRTPTLEVGTHTFRLRQVDLDGSPTHTDPVTVDVSLDGAYSVSAVSPNPLRGRGTVSVTVRQSQPVTATVYNVLGQQVATLHDGPFPAQTPTTLRLGSALSSGVYFLRVEGESFAVTRKFVRL